jgi:hypothetical protein
VVLSFGAGTLTEVLRDGYLNAVCRPLRGVHFRRIYTISSLVASQRELYSPRRGFGNERAIVVYVDLRVSNS